MAQLDKFHSEDYTQALEILNRLLAGDVPLFRYNFPQRKDGMDGFLFRQSQFLYPSPPAVTRPPKVGTDLTAFGRLFLLPDIRLNRGPIFLN